MTERTIYAYVVMGKKCVIQQMLHNVANTMVSVRGNTGSKQNPPIAPTFPGGYRRDFS